MKPIYLAFIFLLMSVSCWANKIDDLKTDKDVERFIISLDSAKFIGTHSRSPKFVILSTDSLWAKDTIAAKKGIVNWQKADLNNDGLTDLIAIAKWFDINPYVVIDKGSGVYKLIMLRYSTTYTELTKLLPGAERPLLVYFTHKPYIPIGKSWLDAVDSIHVDTLIYHFDSFIEFNNNPTIKRFSSITFKAEGDFKITINRRGIAKFSGHEFGRPEYKSRKKIPKDVVDQFNDVLSYLDLKKIKTNYAVNWTDAQTMNMIFKLKDGTNLKVNDYGAKGTFGLIKIYTLCFDLYTKYLRKVFPEFN